MSFAPDNIADALGFGLSEVSRITRVPDGVRVTTHCMYPSNGLVEVMVRGGKETFVASDEGGAVGEAFSAGITVPRSDMALLHLVRDQGLLIKDGIIFTPRLQLQSAALGVLQVANAAKTVAEWLYTHTRIKRDRDFRVLLAEFLRETFTDRILHDETIIGASNKPHKFANVILLHGDRRLIVDPVVAETSSINARVVANLDVKAVNNPALYQRIVYDDEDKWNPADLNLLQVGAIVVPFSRSQDVIRRIASDAPKQSDEQYTEEEADRRFMEAIRRAVTTPHAPQKATVGKTARGRAISRGKTKGRKD